MALKKRSCDYFPHTAKPGQTVAILESEFGIQGYAAWFKLLELLTSADDHYIDATHEVSWRFLLSRFRCDAETASAIIDTLASLDQICPKLWSTQRVIWCQALVDNLSEVYRKRQSELPSRPEFPARNIPASTTSKASRRPKVRPAPHPDTGTGGTAPYTGGTMRQSRVEESILAAVEPSGAGKITPEVAPAEASPVGGPAGSKASREDYNAVDDKLQDTFGWRAGSRYEPALHQLLADHYPSVITKRVWSITSEIGKNIGPDVLFPRLIDKLGSFSSRKKKSAPKTQTPSVFTRAPAPKKPAEPKEEPVIEKLSREQTSSILNPLLRTEIPSVPKQSPKPAPSAPVDDTAGSNGGFPPGVDQDDLF